MVARANAALCVIIGVSWCLPMLVFGVGLAAGAIVAIAAVRLAASLLSGLLFGLTATDAVNLVWAVILMVVVALAACILPAARATRVDPLVALRYE